MSDFTIGIGNANQITAALDCAGTEGAQAQGGLRTAHDREGTSGGSGGIA